jgi:hypothetical protein
VQYGNIYSLLELHVVPAAGPQEDRWPTSRAIPVARCLCDDHTREIDTEQERCTDAALRTGPPVLSDPTAVS